MQLNFKFLRMNQKFALFADAAIEAEKGIAVSNATCAILCRRALEQAVKWLYSIEPYLEIPYQDNLASLIHEKTFKDILDPHLFPLIRFIWKLGNSAVHTSNQIKRDQAVLALRNLFEFCKWIDYCYGDDYEDRKFDESILLGNPHHKKREKPEELRKLYDEISSKDKQLEEMRKANEELQAKMAEIKEHNMKERHHEVDQKTEADTRKEYIDVELQLAGWKIGRDCLEEVQVYGMPTSSGIGRADYVLYGNNGKPLAVVEAKKTGVDTMVGATQAKLYADCLQKQYHQRPLIFITNGFEIDYINDARNFPKRRVSGFFTKDELQLEVDRRTEIRSLTGVQINDEISNRYYQKEAVQAVCDAIEQNHRKMLLVMATGSGKTRTAISIVDVLMKHNYVKHILFLADRTALVRQAKNNFSNLLPNLTLCNLLDRKDDPKQARMIFSTYPTMMNAIDDTKNEFGERLFTPGHFDLIIVDESHRSIYRKYQDIFDYFDGMMLGLTATPKNEIDRNTYNIFELESGVPTYAYELDQAIQDEYLVPYATLEYKTKIMEEGIHYQDLSQEEKNQFENDFDDDENITDFIPNTAINTWLFNSDTIDKVLKELLENGLKVEGGDKLGKTIIFAKNSLHAKAIVERFQTLYPEYGAHFIEQIDYSIKYSDTLIDDFSTKDKDPQIAVSVDMLDTGVDVPEVLNLVFFKKVRSYSKFWQMIGRGTRLCENLFGPQIHKEKFLIFDFCNNFEFFRVSKGVENTGQQGSLTENIYMVRCRIVRELQATENQNEDGREYRKQLVNALRKEIMDLNPDSFRVKLNLRYVEKYQELNAWSVLEAQSITELRKHIAPLVVLKEKEELAKRFDYLIYSIELAMLEQKDFSHLIQNIQNTAERLSKKYNIPQIKEEKYIIEKVMTTEFWETVDLMSLEVVREALRGLIRFLDPVKQTVYYSNYEDHIMEAKEGAPFYAANNLQNYRKKVEYYLKEHENVLSIYKLRNNKKLTKTDFEELERILWQDLGSKEDYEKEYGDTPIGHLVRKIVGLDRTAVRKAFSEFLSEERLNSNQMHFLELLIDYIEQNGYIEDNSVLTKEPFRSVGSITNIFKNDIGTARKILDVSDQIRNNADAIMA